MTYCTSCIPRWRFISSVWNCDHVLKTLYKPLSDCDVYYLLGYYYQCGGNCEQDCSCIYCRQCSLTSGPTTNISSPTLLSNECVCAWSTSVKRPCLACKSSTSTHFHLYKHTHVQYADMLMLCYLKWGGFTETFWCETWSLLARWGLCSMCRTLDGVCLLLECVWTREVQWNGEIGNETWNAVL